MQFTPVGEKITIQDVIDRRAGQPDIVVEVPMLHRSSPSMITLPLYVTEMSGEK
jgi:hypothetical protein